MLKLRAPLNNSALLGWGGGSRTIPPPLKGAQCEVQQAYFLPLLETMSPLSGPAGELPRGAINLRMYSSRICIILNFASLHLPFCLLVMELAFFLI